MKTYTHAFFAQLLIIVMAINVRTDIPFWKQMIAYVVIACIIPLTEFVYDKSMK